MADLRDQLLCENPGPVCATMLQSPAALLSQRGKGLEKGEQRKGTSKEQSRKYIQCLGDWQGGLWGETDEDLEHGTFF